KRQRTVVVTDWREEKREKTIMVPVIKEIERQYKVAIPTFREEKRKTTVLIPDVKTEERERTVTVVRKVAQTQKRQVVTPGRIASPVCDPCNVLVGAICKAVPVVREVCVTVFRCVPETITEKYCVNIPFLRPVTKFFTVRIPALREE